MSSKLIAKVAWWDISMEIKKKMKQKWRLHNARPQLLAGKKHLELVINAPNKAWHLFKACSYMFKINNKIKTAAVNFSSFFRSSRLEVYIKVILKNSKKRWSLLESLYWFFMTSACNFVEKETLTHQCFCKFREIFQSIFFVKHLRHHFWINFTERYLPLTSNIHLLAGVLR